MLAKVAPGVRPQQDQGWGAAWISAPPPQVSLSLRLGGKRMSSTKGNGTNGGRGDGTWPWGRWAGGHGGCRGGGGGGVVIR